MPMSAALPSPNAAAGPSGPAPVAPPVIASVSPPLPGLAAVMVQPVPGTVGVAAAPGSGPVVAAPAATPFRPLNVKDALSYLDRVKVTFSDQSEGEESCSQNPLGTFRENVAR